MEDQLRDHLAAFRIQVRACRNVARTTLQMAADLERVIDEHLAAEPTERQSAEHDDFPRRTERIGSHNGYSRVG